MLNKMKWAVFLAMVLIPGVINAAVEHERLYQTQIGAPILDVAADPANELVFLLTPGAVLIYSTADRAVLDRIMLEEPFDRIAFQGQDRLVLTGAEPSQISMIHFSRIYEIDLTDRAVKGSPDARVTLVVFDDYQ